MIHPTSRLALSLFVCASMLLAAYSGGCESVTSVDPEKIPTVGTTSSAGGTAASAGGAGGVGGVGMTSAGGVLNVSSAGGTETSAGGKGGAGTLGK